MLTETSSTATLTNTLNLGGTLTVTRVGTGEVCIKKLSTTFANVQATPVVPFSGEPTDFAVGVIGQTGVTSPFTCTETGSVYVELFKNGTAADGVTAYLTFLK